MKTIYDVLSILLFAGIAILYLQRSAADEPDSIGVWRYAVVALGCAVGNTLGNQGHPFLAGALLIAVVIGSILLLKPFESWSNR